MRNTKGGIHLKVVFKQAYFLPSQSLKDVLKVT